MENTPLLIIILAMCALGALAWRNYTQIATITTTEGRNETNVGGQYSYAANLYCDPKLLVPELHSSSITNGTLTQSPNQDRRCRHLGWRGR